MPKEVTFDVPRGMNPGLVAQTFAAYLAGYAFFRKGDTEWPLKVSNSTWQLDNGNNFWLDDLNDGRVNLRCRYDHYIPVVEAAVALLKARYGL